MLRGIYASATGMLAEARRLDVIANNVANASTTGYKRDTLTARAFADVLVERLDDRDGLGRIAPPVPVGALGMGVAAAATVTVLDDGPLRFTGRSLDVALQGDGLFTVQAPDGRVLYTRDGALGLDAAGYLVTSGGYRLLLENGQPAGGPAALGRAPGAGSARPGGAGGPAPGEAVEIGEDGTVRVGGQVQGRLAIVSARALGNLHKIGNNLWAQEAVGSELAVRTALPPAGPGAAVPPAPGAPAARTWSLRVGYLEGSSVQPALEMADLIATMRAYEANQRALRMQDEALGRAANDVGRVG